MKLIDLLVKELPRRGGWPEGADECYWHSGFSNVCFYNDGSDVECSPGLSTAGIHYNGDDDGESVTREQYEAALAASKAVVGHDGWIQWAGGECPVDSDAIVEVKYRKPNPYQFNNDRAGDFTWSHDGFGGDIIAYRLQNPGIDSRANDDRLEQDLNECIGQDVDMPEWNGEGLPPAGCECEARYRNADNAEWVFFRCVGVDCGVAFGWLGKEAATLGRGSYEFRPLRTEAERKRDIAAQALCNSCGGTGKVDEDLGFGVMWFDIYDAIAAGKIPGVKLEGK